VDHIACQCEFMALLAGREAVLLGAGPSRERPDERAEQLEVTRRAARDFLKSHLGRFGLAFATSLLRADADGFFAGLAEALSALLHLDAARLDAPLGPPTLDLRPPAVDPAPMACGTCPELAPPREA
jgi:TorA maturation chaperone TorD